MRVLCYWKYIRIPRMILSVAMFMFCSHRKVEGILLWGFHSKRHFKGQDAVLVGPDNKVGFI